MENPGMISLPLRDTFRPPQFSPSGRRSADSGRGSRPRSWVLAIQVPLDGEHYFHFDPIIVARGVDSPPGLPIGTAGPAG
jgi:hypothetical protein